MYLSEQLQEKWRPILDHPALPEITDQHKRAVTSILLENQENAMVNQEFQLIDQEFQKTKLI